MKRVIFLAFVLTGFVASAVPVSFEVNEKILAAFKSTFTDVKNVTWQESEEFSQANFMVGDVQVRARYDENGNLISTIRYYSETELLPQIVSRLKKKYAGKDVTGVTEVSSENGLDFIINIRDDNHWYIVKADIYGNLQQTNKFTRGDK